MTRRSLPMLVCASLAVLMAGCTKSPTAPTPSNVPLTPARSIEGTWRTPTPVTFNHQTDFCGTGQVTGQSRWDITWIITAVAGFTNVVEIEMRNTRGATTPLGNCRPDGWFAPVNPTFIRAAMDGTRIARSTGDQNRGLGVDGSFTTSLIEVTWIHWECIIYCYGEYTDERALKLVKQ